jgi:hypothetical protein
VGGRKNRDHPVAKYFQGCDGIAGLTSGQAGFTAFAVVPFCILLPLQTNVGIRRVEDIALGGAVGLVVSLVRQAGQCLIIRSAGR